MRVRTWRPNKKCYEFGLMLLLPRLREQKLESREMSQSKNMLRSLADTSELDTASEK